MLCYDPAERLSAEEALEHPFFKELHQKENEPANARIEYFDFEFEQYTLDKKILRELITDEIFLYHSRDARDYYEKCKAKYPKGVLEILYQRVGAPASLPSSSSANSSAVKPSESRLPLAETAMEDVETAPSSENPSPENEASRKQQEEMAAKNAHSLVN